MSNPELPAQNDPSHVERQLNGWKEIAAFFGKGVRTVQRWEREMGLPVRRLTGARGEIVFALPSELRAWREKLEQESPNGEDPRVGTEDPLVPAASPGRVSPAPPILAATGGARRRRYIAAALVLVALVAAAATLGLLVDRKPPLSRTANVGPTTVDVRGNTLVALDLRGTVLWSHPFDAPLDYYHPAHSHLLRVVDIDGDERAETLFFAVHRKPHGSVFYCFESDGRIRFRHTLASRHTYGNEVFTAPWLGYRLLVGEPTLGPGEIWIAWIHGIEFPSVVQRLNLKGEILNEFWNGGYISTLVPVQRGGRPLMLAGGTNNEAKSGFLAVIDRGFTGFSPALNPKYACRGCAGSYPERYFIFPRLDVAEAREYLSTVLRIESDEASQTMVGVSHAPNDCPVYYRFDPDFNLIRSEIGPEFVAVHRQLEAQRLLLHPFGAADEAAAANVRVWDGKGFAPLPAGRLAAASNGLAR